MPATYTLIASNTLSSAAASVTFSAIPNTYTDLLLRVSIRTDENQKRNLTRLVINDIASSYSRTALTTSSGTAISFRASNQTLWQYSDATSALATSNTFGSVEVYIPNYNSSANKVASAFGVSEDNTANDPSIGVTALLLSDTSAITSLECRNVNFVSGSSFFLYGIKNS